MTQFKPGGKVLAKFEGFPYWPAMLVAKCHVPEDVWSEFQDGDMGVFVYFVDDHNWGYVTSNHIQVLSEEELDEKLSASKGKKKRAFQALKDLEYWELLIELGIVTEKTEPYTLSSLDEAAPVAVLKKGTRRGTVKEKETGEDVEDQQADTTTEQETPKKGRGRPRKGQGKVTKPAPASTKAKRAGGRPSTSTTKETTTTKKPTVESSAFSEELLALVREEITRAVQTEFAVLKRQLKESLVKGL